MMVSCKPSKPYLKISQICDCERDGQSGKIAVILGKYWKHNQPPAGITKRANSCEKIYYKYTTLKQKTIIRWSTATLALLTRFTNRK